MKKPDRVVLIGPSGSGKSHLGALLATSIGYELVDVDSEIESSIGMTIDEFFERFGESAFRTVESQILRQACDGSGRVVATGGGAVLAAENWAAMRPGAVVVGLTGSAETLVERVQRQQERLGRSAVRPNMTGDPHARMQAMLETRAPYYRQADVEVDTDQLSVDGVLAEIVAGIDRCVGGGLVPALSIETPVERSDLYVSGGVRKQFAGLIRHRWPSASKLWLLTDEHVAKHWLDEFLNIAANNEFDVRSIIVPPGEASKSLEQFGSIVENMTAFGVARSDVVVALGGGVVGDLGGFVAATCLRGLPLVQLPTSLLAMVDSSVGGKTAINTSAGKNMVGAFYQPGLVLIDTDFLSTLPPAEYRSGMAEVIKHAEIQPSTPLASAELDAMLSSGDLDPVAQERINEIVLQNVKTKHSVVQEDERESGLRMILNFGHTAGHAIEADGYRYRHGEAIGLGMLVATHMAVSLDLCGSDRFAALEARLAAAGLPVRYDGSTSTVLTNMRADKKILSGVQRWILPVGEAEVEIRTGIDEDLISSAIAAIGGI